jgi:hypothetical protein
VAVADGTCPAGTLEAEALLQASSEAETLQASLVVEAWLRETSVEMEALLWASSVLL